MCRPSTPAQAGRCRLGDAACNLIHQDRRDKLAEMNRDIVIKSFDAELENVRFAVKTAGDLFTQALNAVGDYVRTVMMGPQVLMLPPYSRPHPIRNKAPGQSPQPAAV